MSRRSIKVDGKVVAITGANSGLGLASARRLAAMGARLILFLRPSKRQGDASDAAVSAELGDALLAIVHCDLSDFASVRAAAAEVGCRKLPLLDVVVLNAGCVTMCTELTAQGLETMRGVMYFGHWLLVTELLKRGRINTDRPADDPARFIAVASEGHRIAPTLNPKALRVVQSHTLSSALRAYGDAKLLLLSFMSELQRRLDDAGSHVQCLCLCPGAMNSNIVPRNVPTPLYLATRPLLKLGFKSPDAASVHLVRLVTLPVIAPTSRALLKNRCCVYFHMGVEKAPRVDATDPVLGKELWEETERIVEALDKNGDRLPLRSSL